ncbi:hypothetical protein ALT761_01137 [Alteromonas sp. 76-1]|jgi:hypothetical protein|nr:hypothetical protein ALT761_01137 [Alteromonas sp. 76-1]
MQIVLVVKNSDNTKILLSLLIMYCLDSGINDRDEEALTNTLALIIQPWTGRRS